MANTLLTPAMITLEALRVLVNNLKLARRVNRQYDDRFAIVGAKIGDTLQIRKPARFVGRDGAALSPEDYTESSVPVTLSQAGCDMEITSKDLTLSLDNFSERIIRPAAATIANKIDRAGALEAKNGFYFSVGTPGTTPNALLTWLTASAKLDYAAAPQDGLRTIILDPIAQATTVDALKGLFQSSERIKEQYERGAMGEAIGFEWAMDQNIVTHTVGPLGGTPTVNGAGQTGSSVVTQAWTAAAASRLKKGDVVQFAGCYQVNPQNRQATPYLQDFVVTADVSSDGAGAATIPISPSIVTSGAYQTVSASPDNGGAVTIFGHASSYANKLTPTNLAFHRDALVLATADMYIPKGVDMAYRVSDEETGISIRFVRAYDVVSDRLVSRLDVLYGWAVVRPELGCRVQG